MSKEQALNKFTKGLLLDMNPMTIPSDTLTNCLNGTIITYNGNEMVLQNDMGNARVETAMLPAGYVPIGTTSFGGIIYILSHNPIEGKYQIGSFPSPERNLSKDELGDSTNTTIDIVGFSTNNQGNLNNLDCTTSLSSNLYQIVLCNKELHSGDKFKVFSELLLPLMNKGYVSGFRNGNKDPDLYPKYLKFDIISVLSNGSIVKLTDNLTWTEFTNSDNSENIYGNFYIYPNAITVEGGKANLDEYRNSVNALYDVYTSKYPGQLGLLCTYEAPSNFSVGYDAIVLDMYNISIPDDTLSLSSNNFIISELPLLTLEDKVEIDISINIPSDIYYDDQANNLEEYMKRMMIQLSNMYNWKSFTKSNLNLNNSFHLTPWTIVNNTDSNGNIYTQNTIDGQTYYNITQTLETTVTNIVLNNNDSYFYLHFGNATLAENSFIYVKINDVKINDVKINDVKALLYFYLNWSNDNKGVHKNRINPQGIYITDDTIIKNYQLFDLLAFDNSTKCSDAIDNIDYCAIKLPDDFYNDNFNMVDYLSKWTVKNASDASKTRKNDGSDFLMVVKGPEIYYNIDKQTNQVSYRINTDKTLSESVNSNMLSLNISPFMPYGTLTWLLQELNINLRKLGTGAIDLILYRYYVDDHKLTLDFKFDTYLELNKRINSIKVNIYTLTSNPKETNESNYTTNQNSDNLGTLVINSGEIMQQSYNLVILKKFYFKESTASNQAVFEKDNIYLLEFIVDYSGELRYYYRILHTSDIFNNKYYDTDDFSELYLCVADRSYGIDPKLIINTPFKLGLIVDNTSSEIEMFNKDSDLKSSYLNYNSSLNANAFSYDFTCGYSKIDELFVRDPENSNIKASFNANVNSDKTEVKFYYSNSTNSSVEIPTNSSVEIPTNSSVKILVDVTNKLEISYNKLKQVYPYEMKKIDIETIPSALLQLWTKHENNGKLKLYVNNTLMYQCDCPDLNHVTADMDEIVRILRQYCDSKKLDMITVNVGIEKCPDDNSSVILYYTLNNNNMQTGNHLDSPSDTFVKFLFIRNANTGWLVGTNAAKSMHIPPGGSSNGYYGVIIQNAFENKGNRYTGFTYDKDHCFKKYYKSNTPISIYTIGDVVYDKNPSIPIEIKYEINNNNNLLKTNYNINNLMFEENSYVTDKYILSINLNILNLSKVNSLMFDKEYLLDIDSDEIDNLNICETVSIKNGITNQLLTVEQDDLGLIYINQNIDSNCKFDMQFCWEDAGSNNSGRQGIRLKGFITYGIL